ncbi:MAG: 4-alpha-glucanotransferase [Candidatus Limnocylindria bacterium]
MSTPELVAGSYVDAHRRRRAISREVRDAVLATMGLAPGEEPPASASVAIVRRGDTLPAVGELTLEDGTPLGRPETLPPDAPFGYHALLRDDGNAQLLIAGPGRCHLPADLRAWGWAIQLAVTRSIRSWGIGDLGDLRDLATWSASAGAGFVSVGPLSAPNPGPHPEPSPYYPSTRRFGNPLYLVTDGADEVGRALNAERLIDRSRVLALKLAALERTWERGGFDLAAFEAWRQAQDGALERWATFCMLFERFGPGWTRWPEAFRDPRSDAVASARSEDGDRVAFHAWIQWCFDQQLAAASGPLRRIADMPVGVDPDGFDAWDWQDQLASGAALGVPPDRFNTSGQDWGFPPFVPHRLREVGYRPFIDTVRAQLRHAGGLRFDHVLGLFRQWWIPAGHDPTEGAYVRQPTDELLEIVAIESHRASAVIVGEDLGTVPAGVRSELRRRRMLSTRLALFERKPPHAYPRQAFAAISTHDLPTLAGLWTGADLGDQAAAGVTPDPDGAGRLRARLLGAAGLGADATLDELVVGLHRSLAASPAMLVAATLEDALRVEERPNLPGTVAPQRANWSLALPVGVDELAADPRVAALVEVLRR